MPPKLPTHSAAENIFVRSVPQSRYLNKTLAQKMKAENWCWISLVSPLSSGGTSLDDGHAISEQNLYTTHKFQDQTIHHIQTHQRRAHPKPVTQAPTN
eukprot:2702408-Amphidinium_carterae.1